VSAMESPSMPNILRQRRGLAGMPKSIMQASVAPPVAYQGVPRRIGRAVAFVVAGVVVIVRVAVPAPWAVMDNGLVEPKLTVGGFWAPLGLEVIVAVSATLPVKPPTDVTVTVEVFDVVAPGAEIVTAVSLIVKLGGIAVTDTDPVPEAAV
jgi:hypothetical protein